MTEPKSLDFIAYQGATFSEVLTWKANETPVDLTGATAKMLVKNGSTTVVTLSTESGGIALGGTAGTITLRIEDTATATLPVFSTGEYDLLVKMGDEVRALIAGKFVVRKGTTLVV